MKTIQVHTKTSSYPIYLTNGFDALVSSLQQAQLFNRKVCIISDDHVYHHYGEELCTLLSKAYQEVSTFTFIPGEASKNLQTIYSMYETFISHHLDRSSLIIALGGGVVGDMAGFAASTYMRGIPFVQIPTSLLAQVDSSVGGKVGVDFMGHKNIIGSFYQPEFVFINVETLRTLPQREFSAGMAEVIKHGAILDAGYLEYVKNHAAPLLSLDQELLQTIIATSCTLKASIVSQDEKESGLREILNFGHTIGHAIETLLDFHLVHGECVGIGMICESFISFKKGLISEDEFIDLQNIIKSYALPASLTELSGDDIYSQLFLDKKTRNHQIQFVLLQKIGKAVRSADISKHEILAAIDYIRISEKVCGGKANI